METPDSLQGDTLAVPVTYVDDLALSPDTTRWAVLGMPSMARPVRALYVGRPGHWQVVAEGDIRPPIAWSPDGQWLAFARRERAPEGGLVYDLWRVSADGHTSQRLTHGRRAFSPAFAPDGQHLAFVSVVGGQAQLQMLDLKTNGVRPLRTFPASVTISTMRWRPDERMLVFDRFVEGVRRDLVGWAIGTDSLHTFTDGQHDDRGPVWSPDGQRLAFTSLRDGVPNVFVLDLASGQVERVTHLVSGARVLDWVPPLPDFPEGQLVVAVTLSKYAEAVRLVDARRRAATRSVRVPEPYRAWTAQRAPSRRMLDTMAMRPVSMSSPRRYRPLSNLTHVASLALPYYLGPMGAGVGGFTVWMEPLGHHMIAASGMVSATHPRYSFGAVSYLSRRVWGTIGGAVYRKPGAAVSYENGTLVEVQTGGELALLREGPAPPYGRRWGSLRLRYRDRRPLWPRHPERLRSRLPPPASGRQLDVTFRLRLERRRPYRYQAVHPLDGEGLRLEFLGAVPALGADLQFARVDVAGYRIWPVVGTHRLFAYGRVQVQRGQSLPQDYLGLSRSDEVHLLLPGIGAEVFAPVLHERVRGYRRLAAGRTVLFGALEYRVLLLPDLQTELLGLVRLGATALAAFVDGAIVRTGMETERLGAGLELKNALHLGPLVLTHALGWAAPLRPNEPGARREVYYRIRAAVPF